MIEKTNGEKLNYVFMDQEYTDLLQKTLPLYLEERFTIVA